jgi:hypothetical protein
MAPIPRAVAMTTQATRKNRSRVRPTPSGKRTTITDADVFGIFEPLSRHAQLTTKQIVAFDRRYPSKTRNRLTDLFHEGKGWLRRSSENVRFANYLSADELYCLGDDAEALLFARGILPTAPWVRATRIGGHSTMPSRVLRLAHDHAASHVALDIEIGARQAGAAFRNHIELIAAAPRRTQSLRNPLRLHVPFVRGAPRWIEPDAVFALGGRVFAIEADMGTESVSRVIRGKILAYREIVASGVVDDQLGVDNLRVLFVTVSEARMRNIMALLASIARNGRSTMFAFAARPDLADFKRAPAPDGRMFREPWLRVGHEDLRLAEVGR